MSAQGRLVQEQVTESRRSHVSHLHRCDQRWVNEAIIIPFSFNTTSESDS